MKRLILPLTFIILTSNNNISMAQNKIHQTAGRDLLGEFAPGFCSAT